MELFLQDKMVLLGLGLLFSSLALFGAFKAGQAIERKGTLDSMQKTLDNMQEFTLTELKQETATELKMILDEYKQTHASIDIPNNISCNEIMEILGRFVEIEETILEKSLALNQIYSDLVYNYTQSVYFAYFLESIMPM